MCISENLAKLAAVHQAGRGFPVSACHGTPAGLSHEQLLTLTSAIADLVVFSNANVIPVVDLDQGL